MSWPSTDFELEIQQELDAMRKVIRAIIKMRQKFGDEYPDKFAELDVAMDEWAARFLDNPSGG